MGKLELLSSEVDSILKTLKENNSLEVDSLRMFNLYLKGEIKRTLLT